MNTVLIFLVLWSFVVANSQECEQISAQGWAYPLNSCLTRHDLGSGITTSHQVECAANETQTPVIAYYATDDCSGSPYYTTDYANGLDWDTYPIMSKKCSNGTDCSLIYREFSHCDLSHPNLTWFDNAASVDYCGLFSFSYGKYYCNATTGEFGVYGYTSSNCTEDTFYGWDRHQSGTCKPDGSGGNLTRVLLSCNGEKHNFTYPTQMPTTMPTTTPTYMPTTDCREIRCQNTRDCEMTAEYGQCAQWINDCTNITAIETNYKYDDWFYQWYCRGLVENNSSLGLNCSCLYEIDICDLEECNTTICTLSDNSTCDGQTYWNCLTDIDEAGDNGCLFGYYDFIQEISSNNGLFLLEEWEKDYCSATNTSENCNNTEWNSLFNNCIYPCWQEQLDCALDYCSSEFSKCFDEDINTTCSEAIAGLNNVSDCDLQSGIEDYCSSNDCDDYFYNLTDCYISNCAECNETIDPCNSTDNNGEFVRLPDYGCVMGQVFETAGFREFKTIPYAKPPLPEYGLRFENPESHPGWKNQSYYDATSTPPACMQTCRPNNQGSLVCYQDYTEISEDCLYLSIWTPYDGSSGSSGDYPVMVYIHGGGYTRGWIGSELNTGRNMSVNNDVIVVSMNYRLGVFGWLYSDYFGNFDGNYGYYDQMFALQWVYDNIKYFGGDKDNIVLFGESAGGRSVTTLLMNYGASSQDTDISGIIKGAIIQSVPFGLPVRTSDDWEGLARRVLKHAGCLWPFSDRSSCMREDVDAQTLLQAQNTAQAISFVFEGLQRLLTWTPTLKTDILPQSTMLAAFEDGEFNKDVPIIMGANNDELGGSPSDSDIVNNLVNSTSIESSSVDYDEFDAILYAFFNASNESDPSSASGSNYAVNSIESEYNATEAESSQLSGGELYDILASILNAMLFQCPTRYLSEQIRIAGGADNWLYDYDYKQSQSWPVLYPKNSDCGTGDSVCHGAELPMLFLPQYGRNGRRNFTYSDTDLHVASIIQNYWTNMANNNGDPGTVDGIKWDKFTVLGQKSLVFNRNGSHTIDQDYLERFLCLFWDSLDYCWLESGGCNAPSTTGDDPNPDTSQSTESDSDDAFFVKGYGFGYLSCVLLILVSILHAM